MVGRAFQLQMVYTVRHQQHVLRIIQNIRIELMLTTSASWPRTPIETRRRVTVRRIGRLAAQITGRSSAKTIAEKRRSKAHSSALGGSTGDSPVSSGDSPDET